MASNKRRRHTPDQIIRKLAEGNKLLASGQELAEVCRHLEIAESTWHRWLAHVGGHEKTAHWRTRKCPFAANKNCPPADTEVPAGGHESAQTCLMPSGASARGGLSCGFDVDA